MLQFQRLSIQQSDRFRQILSQMDRRSRRLPFEKLLAILRSLKRR